MLFGSDSRRVPVLNKSYLAVIPHFGKPGRSWETYMQGEIGWNMQSLLSRAGSGYIAEDKDLGLYSTIREYISSGEAYSDTPFGSDTLSISEWSNSVLLPPLTVLANYPVEIAGSRLGYPVTEIREETTPYYPNLVRLFPPVSVTNTFAIDLVYLEFWHDMVVPEEGEVPTHKTPYCGNLTSPYCTRNDTYYAEDITGDPTSGTGISPYIPEWQNVSSRLQYQYRIRVVRKNFSGATYTVQKAIDEMNEYFLNYTLTLDERDTGSYIGSLVSRGSGVYDVLGYLGTGYDLTTEITGTKHLYDYLSYNNITNLWTIDIEKAKIESYEAHGSFEPIIPIDNLGQIYMLPLTMVYRRNTEVYDEASNPFGTGFTVDGTDVCEYLSSWLGVAPYPTSGHPSGYLCDEIGDGDVIWQMKPATIYQNPTLPLSVEFKDSGDFDFPSADIMELSAPIINYKGDLRYNFRLNTWEYSADGSVFRAIGFPEYILQKITGYVYDRYFIRRDVKIQDLNLIDSQNYWNYATSSLIYNHTLKMFYSGAFVDYTHRNISDSGDGVVLECLDFTAIEGSTIELTRTAYSDTDYVRDTDTTSVSGELSISGFTPDPDDAIGGTPASTLPHAIVYVNSGFVNPNDISWDGSNVVVINLPESSDVEYYIERTYYPVITLEYDRTDPVSGKFIYRIADPLDESYVYGIPGMELYAEGRLLAKGMHYYELNSTEIVLICYDDIADIPTQIFGVKLLIEWKDPRAGCSGEYGSVTLACNRGTGYDTDCANASVIPACNPDWHTCVDGHCENASDLHLHQGAYELDDDTYTGVAPYTHHTPDTSTTDLPGLSYALVTSHPTSATVIAAAGLTPYDYTETLSECSDEYPVVIDANNLDWQIIASGTINPDENPLDASHLHIHEYTYPAPVVDPVSCGASTPCESDTKPGGVMISTPEETVSSTLPSYPPVCSNLDATEVDAAVTLLASEGIWVGPDSRHCGCFDDISGKVVPYVIGECDVRWRVLTGGSNSNANELHTHDLGGGYAGYDWRYDIPLWITQFWNTVTSTWDDDVNIGNELTHYIGTIYHSWYVPSKQITYVVGNKVTYEYGADNYDVIEEESSTNLPLHLFAITSESTTLMYPNFDSTWVTSRPLVRILDYGVIPDGSSADYLQAIIYNSNGYLILNPITTGLTYLNKLGFVYAKKFTDKTSWSSIESSGSYTDIGPEDFSTGDKWHCWIPFYYEITQDDTDIVTVRRPIGKRVAVGTGTWTGDLTFAHSSGSLKLAYEDFCGTLTDYSMNGQGFRSGDPYAVIDATDETLKAIVRVKTTEASTGYEHVILSVVWSDGSQDIDAGDIIAPVLMTGIYDILASPEPAYINDPTYWHPIMPTASGYVGGQVIIGFSSYPTVNSYHGIAVSDADSYIESLPAHAFLTYFTEDSGVTATSVNYYLGALAHKITGISDDGVTRIVYAGDIEYDLANQYSTVPSNVRRTRLVDIQDMGSNNALIVGDDYFSGHLWRVTTFRDLSSGTLVTDIETDLSVPYTHIVTPSTPVLVAGAAGYYISGGTTSNWSSVEIIDPVGVNITLGALDSYKTATYTGSFRYLCSEIYTGKLVVAASINDVINFIIYTIPFVGGMSATSKSVYTTTSDYSGFSSWYSEFTTYNTSLWACNQESRRDLIYTKASTLLHTISFEPYTGTLSRAVEYFMDSAFGVSGKNLNVGDADDAVSTNLITGSYLYNLFRFPTVIRDRVTALPILYPTYEIGADTVTKLYFWNYSNYCDLKSGMTSDTGHGNWAKAMKIGFST